MVTSPWQRQVTKAQRSTRRRPVSVDCEINYDLTKNASTKRDESGNHGNHISLTKAKMQQDMIDFMTSATTEQGSVANETVVMDTIIVQM